jgi:hypothetical protein
MPPVASRTRVGSGSVLHRANSVLDSHAKTCESIVARAFTSSKIGKENEGSRIQTS